MGKAGKERKRKRFENDVNAKLTCNIVDSHRCIRIMTDVVDAFGNRLDIYKMKKFKQFRKELYPLIKIQESSYFDLPKSMTAKLHDTEFDAIVSTENLILTIEYINFLVSSPNIFQNLEHKCLRRALHRLVKYHLSLDQNSTLEVIELENDIDPDLIGSISHCFHYMDWDGALQNLRLLSKSSSKIPKLGTLQRWIRDCDVSSRINESADQKQSEGLIRCQESFASSHNIATNSNHQQHLPITTTDSLNHTPTQFTSTSKEKQIIKNTSLLLLDAVLRVMCDRKVGDPSYRDFLPQPSHPVEPASNSSSISPSTASLVHHPYFSASSVRPTTAISQTASSLLPPTSNDRVRNPAAFLKADFMSYMRVIFHTAGADRRPPSSLDLNVYTLAPNTLRLEAFDTNPLNNQLQSLSKSSSPFASTTSIETNDSSNSSCQSSSSTACKDTLLPAHPHGDSQEEGMPTVNVNVNVTTTTVNPQRFNIPNVPGAFLLTNVLSVSECHQFIAAAETAGFVPDAVDGIDNMMWLADDSLLTPLFHRCRALLPPAIKSCALAGINARWRFFRYYPGAVYRPHIDGAWRGSGICPETGMLSDDVFGDRVSKLTFLVYLNGGFEGGATTFFLPRLATEVVEGSRGGVLNVNVNDESCLGCIDAWGVEPQEGAVLCFPHGNSDGSLVHEGSAVVRGVKYVLRTDVLYYNQPNEF